MVLITFNATDMVILPKQISIFIFFYLKNSNLKQKKKKKNPNKQNQHLICFFPQNFFFEAKHKLGFWMD